MSKQYSQIRAMLSITRASLRAIFRSPSAIIFSFAFPLIFILVFGFIGSGGRVSVRIAFDKQTDTTSEMYRSISSMEGIRIVKGSDQQLKNELEKGRLHAIVQLRKNASQTPAYTIRLISSEAVNPQNIQVLRSMLEGMINGINKRMFSNVPTYATVSNEVEKVPGRVDRTIDFILPGQLGFSLLSAGVFGVAFIFYSLRQTLVLKRFFATPIRRSYIVFGEAISRVVFQLTTAVVILLIGHFAFQFTLIYGAITFFELLVLSFIGLAVFMGFGVVVSGLAKNESSIPPSANLFTLPQFLLSGTFFPIDNFPGWLQPLCKILPLTHLNDAMRNVAFEGARFSDCGTQLAVLGAWGVVAYAIAIRVFKWE